MLLSVIVGCMLYSVAQGLIRMSVNFEGGDVHPVRMKSLF